MNIWPWSRIHELEHANANLNRRLEQWEDSIGRDISRVLVQVNTLTPGIGRIIAKLEPGFTVDEQDPARKAKSDRLAKETIRRLEAEAAAREPYNNV